MLKRVAGWWKAMWGRRRSNALRGEFNEQAVKLGYACDGEDYIKAAITIAKRCFFSESQLEDAQIALRKWAHANKVLVEGGFRDTARIEELEKELARYRELTGSVPGLSPAEVERLAILAENCGAVAKAIGKVVRFGWESSSPYGGRPNRAALEREIGNVRAIVNLMLDADDLRLNELQAWQRSKRAALAKWTLYQECSMSREEQLGMMASIAENVQAAD